DIGYITVQLKQTEDAIRDRLTEVPLTIEEIEDIILPFHLDQTVQQIKGQAEILQEEEVDLQAEKRMNETEMQRIEKEIKTLEQQLYDETTLEERKTANKRY